MKRFVGSARPSTLGDRLSIVSRFALLVGVLVCSIVVAVIFESLQGDSCILSLDFQHVNGTVTLQQADPFSCHFFFIVSCVSTAVAGFFSVICLKNLCQANLLPQVSWTAKLHHFIMFGLLVLLALTAGMVTTQIENACDTAQSVRGYSSASCAQAFSDLGTAWCTDCPSADYSGRYANVLHARNALWASVAMLCVVVVLVAVRHVRARREQEAKDQEEKIKREWEEKKKVADAKDPTKGIVYNLLL